MTLVELEHAEKCMQQQWHDLVMAEQQGNSLEVLERMYDTYILLAEEYNRCCEAYQQDHRVRWESASAPKRGKKARLNSSSDEGEGRVRMAS